MRKKKQKYHDPNIEPYEPLGSISPTDSSLADDRVCEGITGNGRDSTPYYVPVSKSDGSIMPRYKVKTYTEVSIHLGQASFKKKEDHVMHYKPIVRSKSHNGWSYDLPLGRKYWSSSTFLRIAQNVRIVQDIGRRINRWYKIFKRFIRWNK